MLINDRAKRSFIFRGCMISEQDLKLVQQAINIYDKMAGKTYLIAYSPSKNQPLKVIEITISEENFWHLLGCKVCPGTDHKSLFNQCLTGQDVHQQLSYTRKSQDLKRKASIFNSLFDFVDNAKMLTLCDTTGLPEEVMFQIGAGSANGIIGYAKVSSVYIPKSTQDKSIFSLKSNANDRIFLIMSKETGTDTYENLEYIASKKAQDIIISKIPDEYKTQMPKFIKEESSEGDTIS